MIPANKVFIKDLEATSPVDGNTLIISSDTASDTSNKAKLSELAPVSQYATTNSFVASSAIEQVATGAEVTVTFSDVLVNNGGYYDGDDSFMSIAGAMYTITIVVLLTNPTATWPPTIDCSLELYHAEISARRMMAYDAIISSKENKIGLLLEGVVACDTSNPFSVKVFNDYSSGFSIAPSSFFAMTRIG